MMQFLLDISADVVISKAGMFPHLVLGQLLTPLTSFRDSGMPYAIDNGAFSSFDMKRFRALLQRQSTVRDRCIFVTCPDVVESARRTLEVFDRIAWSLEGWPIALALQDGIEDFAIPWDLLQCVFIRGSDRFKESDAAAHVVKAAHILGKHIHCGRVNTIRRYRKMESLGVHTCDGTGVSLYDWMLKRIAANAQDDNLPLFDKGDGTNGDGGATIQPDSTVNGLQT